MVQEHLLGERGALAERQQLQHRIFLAGQVHAGTIDLDRLGVEIDRELAGLDHRLRMALRTADDRVDAGDQFLAMERLGDIIVGAEAQCANLGVHLGNARQDQHRRLHPARAQFLEHVIAGHVRQVEVQCDQVVIVELAEVQALFAEIGGVDVDAFGRQHELDAAGGGGIILDQQNAHAKPLFSVPDSSPPPES